MSIATPIPLNVSLIFSKHPPHMGYWVGYDYEINARDGMMHSSRLVIPDQPYGLAHIDLVNCFKPCQHNVETGWLEGKALTIDQLEDPKSYLVFLTYVYLPPGEIGTVDMRGYKIRVKIASETDLKGATCYFWVLREGTRWHYVNHPIHIWDNLNEAAKAPPEEFELINDDKLWHRSWIKNNEAWYHYSLDNALENCLSYGFSLVGFTDEIHGKLLMRDFSIVESNG